MNDCSESRLDRKCIFEKLLLLSVPQDVLPESLEASSQNRKGYIYLRKMMSTDDEGWAIFDSSAY
jgi:hypothetical protein